MIKKMFLFTSVLVFTLVLVGCGSKVNEDAVPDIVVDNTKQLVFAVGDSEPDWTTYFIVEDENDGTVTITTDMITESVDMNTSGVYVVRLDFTNSVGGYFYKEITIEVESDIEINVEYVLTNGIVGNTYKFEGVEVVYKTNDEYGLYIYDANSESDVNYFYITAFEETLSDAMYDLNVGDIIDIAGELVLYKGNQQPRFENVSIIEKTGTVNNQHDITADCTVLTMDEYYNLKNDTTDVADTSREAWMTYGQCYTVQGLEKELHSGAFYLVDPFNDKVGLYAWAYGEGTPIADFDNTANVGKVVTVDTFFYNMHTVGSLNGDYARSALIDVTVHSGLSGALTDLTTDILTEGNTFISENLTLPTTGTGYTVTWQTSDASLLTNTGVVTRGAYSEEVILTYTITEGTNTFTGKLTLTVIGLVAPAAITVVGTDFELDLDGTVPDFTTYFTVSDETDGTITVTSAMITSTLDITSLGAYTVTLEVTNSNSLTSTETIIIDVTDGTTVIDAAWLLTDSASKIDNLYTIIDVIIVSKGIYGDEGFVYDGTNFIYIDAYGTDFEEAFIAANLGDEVSLTGYLSLKHDFKIYLSDLVKFEVTEAADGSVFDYGTTCAAVTVSELVALVETGDTYIKCFEVTGTVTEELYEGDVYYNFSDTVNTSDYFIAYSNTPAGPKELFDLNTGEEITVRMFLSSYNATKSHFGYFWITEITTPVVTLGIEEIVASKTEGDNVDLNNVTVVSKTSDDTGLYVTDGEHFLYINAYGTAFEDIAITFNVGDIINVSGLYEYNYTYKMMVGSLTNLVRVTEGPGTFDYTGLCIEVTASELFAIKDTPAAFINCYDVTGEVQLEDGTYWNFGDIVNTSEYFIAYSYAPTEAKDEFDLLGEGNEVTVRMFYFRYREEKSHGGYYWFIEVLSVEKPVITLTEESLLLPKDNTAPDFTTYFTVTDEKDGDITVTTAMITESVNMAVAGDYDVVITVTDADSNTITRTITVTVVDPADIDIPWIVENANSDQEFTFTSVTVVSKTSDDTGMYIYDGEYFFYVNAYNSDTAVKDAVIALNEGDIIDVTGTLFIDRTYKKALEATAVTLDTASTGEFDYTGVCIDITASELFAIKDTPAVFINCYNVTGEVQLEAGSYWNFGDIVNTTEYFIAYSYAPTEAKDEFDLLGEGNEATIRMFLFRYRDDKTHGGYYWMLEILSVEKPVVTVTDEPLLLPKDSTAPDFTTYFTVTDETDGSITVTTAMITETVNMAVAGSYDVVISVTDADSNTMTKTITITVVDPADIDIPWIVEYASSDQEFTFTTVTVASKTSDGSGMYVYDGEYFFYVNAYYSDTAVKNAVIALSEGDIIDITGTVYIDRTYKKILEVTSVTLDTASTGEFDYTGICIDITVSELFAIKTDGMTFVNCYNVTGTVWVEAGSYYNLMDTTNTTEYFIEYGYGPTQAQTDFELLSDGDAVVVRMFLFRYRDDKTHGGYYWIDEVTSD